MNIIGEYELSPETEDGLMLFSHPDLAKKLSTVTKLCCDATFSPTPKIYSQLWMILEDLFVELPEACQDHLNPLIFNFYYL